MRYFLVLLCSLGLLWGNPAEAQQQKPQLPDQVSPGVISNEAVKLRKLSPVQSVAEKPSRPSIDYTAYSNSLKLPENPTQNLSPQVIRDKKSNLPVAIQGMPKLPALQFSSNPVETAYSYLDALKNTLQVETPTEEFVLRHRGDSPENEAHLRFQQVYRGIPVFGSEVIVHLRNGKPDFFNGRYFPSPQLASLVPVVEDTEAIDIIKKDLPEFAQLKELGPKDFSLLPAGQQFQSRLVIYHVNNEIDAEYLAWQVTAFPNITERWEYFVDAQTGTILHRLQSSCKFHNHTFEPGLNDDPNSPHSAFNIQHSIIAASPLGPVTANAVDLHNTTRLIQVYEVGGTYYMIDASRDMHDSQNAALSNFPNQPAGVIWTLDAGDTSPQNSNFDYDHVTSFNNTWSDRNSVSAHFNGGEAYTYFEEVHQRNSVNGSGGNIISLINVADENGNDMDNAFWNGAAMFYGNGRQAFNAPLAKALDVAGHEMSHGVIQATANLTYENQSGALNESFADIFGAMMDRDDWQIGEEVANSNIFPTGTMRDMQNPHNGGNSNDFYWQPQTMSEFQNLPNTPQGDFGGVHINSGIPNHAYYLFATAVGKDRAEKVYYKALEDYLVASSQFVDLRIAVLRAAGDLYDQSVVNAAASAFDQVEIFGDEGGDYQTDVEENPGDDVILFADLSRLDLFYPGNGTTEQLSNTAQDSRPSISDDGTFVVFVDDQRRLKGININWGSGEVQEYFLETTPQTIWRNIAVSKDGNKVAFLRELTNDPEIDRQISVFDFTSQSSTTFELYNPTTSDGGISTGDVRFADVLEWDHTGEYLLYDAFNELTGIGGADISYWDIGLIRVWNNAANTFGDGVITKVFSGLQENENIGNPTFSKNSPYIMAFDYFAIDEFGQETYVLYGANMETNDIGIIDNQIFKLSFPSYAPDDQLILYSDLNNGQDIIIQQSLAADKIQGIGNWVGLIGDATWAIWFANGQRDLVSVSEIEKSLDWKIYPNPITDDLIIEIALDDKENAQVELLNVLGQVVYQQLLPVQQGNNRLTLDLPDLEVGMYTLRLQMEATSVSQQVLKLK